MEFNLLEKEQRPLGPNYLGYVLGVIYVILIIALVVYIVIVKSDNAKVEEKEKVKTNEIIKIKSEISDLDSKINEINTELTKDRKYLDIKSFKEEYDSLVNNQKMKYLEVIDYVGKNTPIELGIQTMEIGINGFVSLNVEAISKEYVDAYVKILKRSELFTEAAQEKIEGSEKNYRITINVNMEG